MPATHPSAPVAASVPDLEFVGSTGAILDFGELTHLDGQDAGRIVALDRMTSLVHVLDPDGSHLTLEVAGGELASCRRPRA